MGHYLIISGSSDIGRETASRLIKQGNEVTITSRSEMNRDLAAQIGARFSILDSTNFDDTLTLIESIIKSSPNLDGIVNCSGSILLKPAHLTSAHDYEETLKINLTTAFATVRAAGKTMTNRGGSVVLLSSAAAIVGLPNHEAIAAAKAGVIGLALSAAATYAMNNLRINVVAPGLVDTKLSHSLTANADLRKISENMHPLNRLGTVGDIASAICFLLNPENSWISGEVLSVDGGLSHLRKKMKA